jgi:hypothetical protein
MNRFHISAAMIGALMVSSAQAQSNGDNFASELRFAIGLSDCQQGYQLVPKTDLELIVVAWTYVPDETKKRVESSFNSFIAGNGGFDKFCDDAWRAHRDRISRR